MLKNTLKLFIIRSLITSQHCKHESKLSSFNSYTFAIKHVTPIFIVDLRARYDPDEDGRNIKSENPPYFVCFYFPHICRPR